MGTRTTYTAEFKQKAVELAKQEGNTVKGIARDLGVGRSTLSKNWKRCARSARY